MGFISKAKCIIGRIFAGFRSKIVLAQSILTRKTLKFSKYLFRCKELSYLQLLGKDLELVERSN
jgi:hypothetical protein